MLASPAAGAVTPVVPASGLRLGSIDRFMLAFDGEFRRRTGRGNICVIAVHLASSEAAAARAAAVAAHPLFKALGSLRLAGHRWVESGPPAEPTTISGSDLDGIVAGWDMDPQRDAPLQLRVVVEENRSTLLCAWHHALVDAHGGELIWLDLLQGTAPPELLAGAGHAPAQSLLRALAAARPARRHILEAARAPIAWLAAPHRVTGAVHYHHLTFSPEETLRVLDTARRLHVELFQSTLCLAAVARGVGAILTDRGVKIEDLHVPVPHDLRRPPLRASLSNNLSFLFYRIPAKTLGSLEATTHAILDQAHSSIATGLHKAGRSFMEVVRPLPDRLYRSLLLHPTRGGFASFFFSDTGRTLDRFDEVPGILDVQHYPPNFAPPGFTAVLSRFRGSLRCVVIYTTGVVEPAELLRFEHSLRGDLLDG